MGVPPCDPEWNRRVMSQGPKRHRAATEELDHEVGVTFGEAEVHVVATPWRLQSQRPETAGGNTELNNCQY